jgi:hypothetical protein
MTEELEFDYQQKLKIFLYSQASRENPVPTQPSIQRTARDVPLELVFPRVEADLS